MASLKILIDKFFDLICHPLNLVALIWAVCILGYIYGPLDYYRQVAPATWLVLAVCFILFALGYYAARFFAQSLKPQPVTYDPRRIEQAIIWTSVIGLVGIFAVAFDKVLLSGLDYTAGLAEVRYRRDIDLAKGVDVDRSPLLYLGYLTFSFAYCALGLFLLRAEEVRRIPAIVAQISFLSPLVYALLYGGRFPIMLVCSLVVGTFMVRHLTGKSFFPRAHGIFAKFIILCVAFVLYINFTWEDRREYSNVQGYEGFLIVADVSWETKPKAWMDYLIREEYIDADKAMNVMSIWLYLTHSIPTFDKIVEHHSIFTPAAGLFQIGVLSPIFRIFFPNNTLLSSMSDQLAESEIHGWFVSFVGAVFIDTGIAGAIISILFWGAFAGFLFYTVTRRGGGICSQLLLGWTLGQLTLSTLNSPIGVANSNLIFGAMICTVIMLRWRLVYAPKSKSQPEEPSQQPVRLL